MANMKTLIDAALISSGLEEKEDGSIGPVGCLSIVILFVPILIITTILFFGH